MRATDYSRNDSANNSTFPLAQSGSRLPISLIPEGLQLIAYEIE
jgi:hypothetical protein